MDSSSSFRLAYVHKTLKHYFGLWNVGQGVPLLEAPVPCGDEIFPCPPHPLTGEPLPLIRLPEPFFSVQDWRVDTYPDARNSYDTIQIVYNQRPGGRIWFQASFDYQWRDELKARTASGSPLVSDPVNIDYFQNHNADVGNRQTSTNWQLKALARLKLPKSSAVSVNFRHQSGYPWAPLYNERIPGSGFQNFYLEDVDRNRSDNVTLIDLRAEKSFDFGDHQRLSAMVDIYNLLNSNAETNFVLRTGPAFRDLIAALDPITLKIGVRWQF